jgi:hypothetical protein
MARYSHEEEPLPASPAKKKKKKKELCPAVAVQQEYLPPLKILIKTCMPGYLGIQYTSFALSALKLPNMNPGTAKKRLSNLRNRLGLSYINFGRLFNLK